MTNVRPSWWPAWLACVVATMRDIRFRSWLYACRVMAPADLQRVLSPPSRGGEFAYHYDGRLASWAEARRRGWAACAEVAAYAAAAALVLWPTCVVRAIGEGQLTSDVAYSHLRVDVDGVVVDPYDREARLGEASVVDWYGVVDGVDRGVVVMSRPVALEDWR